ncbi:hypothetical protein niasHS_003960 [Heterodera schachtii]|uniref:TATA-binding protein-associated factor n=1 Tax=Heterodera schachtii TaxID=97005 RepID=A0ABD2K3T2_HETSC
MFSNWQCRQTALLVLKYHFAVSEFNLDAERTLFDDAIHSLAKDPFDEVISSATQSLCSLFSNPNVDERTTKRSLIDRVMQSAWALMDCPSRMTQFREGVDSVLVDLLRLVAFWLRVSPSAPLLLTDVRLRLVVSLLDCSQHSPTRATRALECICGALEQRKKGSLNEGKGDDSAMGNVTAEMTDWSGQTLFFLLQQLYRCLLFTPPSAPPAILTQCQQTLDALLAIVDESSHRPNSQKKPEGEEDESAIFFRLLGHSIGVWLCSLVYDHRFTEIDVFLHHVNGPNSSRDSPREILCGDEMRFLNATQCDEVLVERKALAARFLAPLFHALFNLRQSDSSDEHSENRQTLSTNVHLLFVPYLRSNSLYQKFGAALVVNAWAVYQHKKSEVQNSDECAANSPPLAPNGNEQNGKAQTPPPHVLLQEIANSLNVVSTSTKLYDEVSQMVTSLSTECNEFQQYCVRKGVPKEALVSLTHANSMEDVILATFLNCEQRLSRADDRQALSARHKIIVEQIARTKLAIRTYTNRVTALFASALFHFASNGTVPLPAQLTPLVKPLMDALESEISRSLAASLLAPAFVALLRSTARREPCPHAKVLRQLCLGLAQCGELAASDQQNRVLSLEHLESEEQKQQQQSAQGTSSLSSDAIKARNCELILRHITAVFGDGIEQNCAELVHGPFCSLKALREMPTDGQMGDKETEVILLQMDALRVIFPALRSSVLRRRIIRERIAPHIQNCFVLLSSANPAVRFRVSRFLSEFASAELCPILKLCYQRFSDFISGPLSNSNFARCGVVELLLITLLPLENRYSHFLAELVDPSDGNSQLANAYAGAFSLVDVLCAPANLPRIGVDQIPWLNTELRHYQLEGITWLSFLHRFGLNGILADDMGLGKTLQVLSLLAWDFGKKQNGDLSAPSLSVSSSSLIVCPRTLIDHWCNEWHSHFPYANVKIYKLSQFKAIAAAELQKSAFVLVASYEELKSNRLSTVTSDGHRWNYLVLDEGHCIRNPNSQLFDFCCSVRAAHRLILSGTPVQNSPADLWALFHFLMPGYLSTRAVFQAKFMRHILACRNARATEQQCKDGEKALQLLHRQCLPFVMRRLKTDVLTELPEKIVQDQQCELSDLQKALYQLVVDNCAVGQQPNSASDRNRWFSPLQALHMLRKIVDHPSLINVNLIDQIYAGNSEAAAMEKRQRIMEEMKKLSVDQSGKMVAFRDLLIQCQIGDRTVAMGGDTEGSANDQKKAPSASFAAPPPVAPPLLFPSVSGGAHRALVFCQWRATLELIIHFLDRGAFGADISWLRLDSTVPAKDRQSVVDRFNTDPSIDLLLLTTHIGGVGLNLTGADVVIFVDHDWNPFRDLQAIDRAHRLGQKRTVNVYRLITRGTVEEKVMRLQRFKSDTANALVGADNRSLAGMATDELLELFSLGDGADDSAGKRRREQPKAKRPRMDADEAIAAAGQWALEELWTVTGDEDDEKTEQYMQTHCIDAFLHATTKR